MTCIISTAMLFWRQLTIKAYKRKHFKLCQGTLILHVSLPCRDNFLMQRERKSNEIYMLQYQTKEKGKKTGPLPSLSLGFHASWNHCRRKSPAHYFGRHPQNHTCVFVWNIVHIGSLHLHLPAPVSKPQLQYVCQDNSVKNQHKTCSEVLLHAHKPLNLPPTLKESWLWYFLTPTRKRMVVHRY